MKNYIEEVALSGVSANPPTLTPEKGYFYALSFLQWLLENTGKRIDEIKIAVAQDPRLSGRLLKISCFDALVPYGVTCIDCNISSLPSMEAFTRGFLDNELICDASILITSSRGDSHINGLKFFNKDGLLNIDNFSKILINGNDHNSMDKLGFPKYKDNYRTQFGKKVYNTLEFDANNHYSSYMVDKIRKALNDPLSYDRPLLGSKVLIDASNGCGGFLATGVFAKLGADISSCVNLIPDGNFFSHLPDPTDTNIRNQISVKTISTGSNLGLLFDTDISSFAAYDSYGSEIHNPEEADDFENWLIMNLKKIKS